MPCTVPAYRGVSRLSCADWEALEATAASLDMKVECLATIISIESGFRPDIENPFGCVGLIQFCPVAQKHFKVTGAELKAMSFQQQLHYVRRFYQGVTWTMPEDRQDCGQVYLATFMPAHLGDADDVVIFSSPSKGYVRNKGLDIGKDGELSARDVRDYARARAAPSGSVTLQDEAAPPPPAESAGLFDVALLLIPFLFVLWGDQ